MKKQPKSGSFRTKGETIVAKAICTVHGFGDTYRKFEQQTTLEQGSKSALQNYGRSITKIANHFGTNPLYLGIEQINDYLYTLLKNSSPSMSYFRHTVGHQRSH